MVVGNSFGKHMGYLSEQEVKVDVLHLVLEFNVSAAESSSRLGPDARGLYLSSFTPEGSR